MNARRLAVLLASVLAVIAISAWPVFAQEEKEEGKGETPPEAEQKGEGQSEGEEPVAVKAEQKEEEKEGGAWDWNLNLFAGIRNTDASEWNPYEVYNELGLEATWGKKGQPILFATDIYISQDKEDVPGGEVASQVWQFSPGLRKIWFIKKHWAPYFGAGVNYAQADYETLTATGTETIDDATWGFWAGGGFMARVGAHFNVGVAMRFEANRVYNIAGMEREGNSVHYGLVLGWGSAPPTD